MIISELTPHITHDAARESCRCPIGAVTTGSAVTLAFTDGLASVLDAELVLYGDGFESRHEMALSDGRWYVSVTMPEEPAALWYVFRISLSGGEYWLCAGEGGRFGQLMSARGEGFRLTVYAKGFETPAWFRRCIMYQIFPDRFARDWSDTAREGIEKHRAMGRHVKYHEDWNEPVDWQPNSADGFYFPLDFYGGTLKGVESRLNYLKSLGVGVIYFNPVFEACSNHRYDTADYLNIDPILGTNADFEDLCTAAERMGIRIMLDGVFSHTGADSIYFNKFSHYPDAGAYNAGSASPYYGWYDFRHYPNDYRCWWNFPDLPEVDEGNADWRDFVITGRDSVVRTWIRRGAAGWRLDVADELPDEALCLIRQAAKAEAPDAVVLGEVWEDAVIKHSYGSRRKYALGESLDSVMNYPFRSAVIDFLCFRTDARALAAFLLGQRLNYPAPMYFSLMNLLSSHDVERVRTALATRLDARSMSREQQAGFIVGDAQDARGAAMQRLAAAIQYAIPGVPCVYYGDETGMGGMLDPFDRAPFTTGARPLTDWYTALGKIRSAHDALSTGAAAFFAPDADVICILRCISGGADAFGEAAADGAFLAVINRTDWEKDLVLDLWLDNAGLTAAELAGLRAQNHTRAECLLTGETAEISEGLLRLKLPPESVRIFELK